MCSTSSCGCEIWQDCLSAGGVPLRSWLRRAGALALFPLAVSGWAAHAADRPRRYAALQGEVLLDNPRVLVERFELPPGQATGRHTRPGDQLLVFVKGGVLKSAATGRSTLWRDGRVVWQDSSDPGDEGSQNIGAEPVVMIWVTL